MRLFEERKNPAPLEKTVLVVDDEPDLIEIVKSYLEDGGYHVISAPDGTSGLEKAVKEKPALIILDIAMPGMTGLEVLGNLKNRPGLAAVPVIMLTAQGQSTNILESDRLGAADFLIKPFTREELLETVRKFC